MKKPQRSRKPLTRDKRKEPSKKGKPMYGIALRAQGPVTTPAPPHPKTRGQRMIFTQEMADLVCERIAIDGHSLKEIDRDPDMPCAGTILKWVAEVPSFALEYARARERLLEHWAEDTLDIANTPHMGEKTEISDQFGTKIIRGDMIEHRRLQIDARRWLLSKLAPRKYGDKLDLNLGGQDGNNPVQLEDVRASNLASIEQIATRFPSATTGETSSDSKDTVSQDADAGADEKL